MAKTVKVAITLPMATFRSIERVRRKRKMSRSAVILEALGTWRSTPRYQRLVRHYVEGYLRKPESREELEPFVSAQADVLAKDSWE
jgi:hypothetical protein